MAHLHPINSRAMATTTWLACVPRALNWWYRLQSLPWACQFAGDRYAQAPATRARRAWVVPALVMEPWRRRSPVEYAEGMRPTDVMRSLGVSTRVRSPSSATVVTATVHWTPRRAWRASTTGWRRQALTRSWRAYSRRRRRSVCSVTARTYACKTMGCAGVGHALQRATAEGPGASWPGPCTVCRAGAKRL
jgi:hypothetical protein